MKSNTIFTARRLINHFELLILFNIIYAITPPQDGKIPQKYQEYFINNNIGRDYGNSAWQYRLHNKQLDRSTEVDSFFIPVIMANYTDFIGTINSAIYKEHLFGNNSTGSFSDYYKEVSYNKFYPTGDVYGWYSTTKSKSQAVEDSRSFVVSVLDSSDNDIDFRKYDNDGPDNIPNSGDDDGYVDGVIIIYPGNGADSGIDENNIWPHKWSLGYDYEYTTNDLSTNGSYIKVSEFVLCPEKYNSDIRSIGVYVHEFGHILGLPDLYDTYWNSTDPSHDIHEGIGNWGVMAGGSWLGNAGDTPSHFSAWSKIKLGWVNPIEITSGYYMLPPVINDGIIYKIIGSSYNENPTGFNSEYFLLENRQKTGFDTEIPGDGMLIFHIDEIMRNNRNQNHKKVDLEEADGDDDLDNEYNRGDAGDPYPGSSNNTEFSISSYPNNYSYYDNSSAFEIKNIRKSGDIVDFSIQTDIENNGEQIKYDTDYNYGRWGWATARDIYAGVLFQSELSGNIKGIDIRLPGIWEKNTYDDYHYLDKYHLFEIFIYENLNTNGDAQNLLFSSDTISYTGQGWYHVNIDLDLPVISGQEFFAVYKIPDGTYDIYVDQDKNNLSNRSYFRANGDNTYYIPISYGNITLRAWIEGCPVNIDCAGECGGTAWESDCGCVAEGNSGDECDDCAGTPNGDSWMSDCGCVAEGNSGDECDDCANTPNGSATIDNCGTCDNDPSNDCTQDCADVWGGSAVFDDCGKCEGNGWDGCDDDGNGINNKEQYGYGAYGFSISDIPDDQGGYVYLSFTKSFYDTDTLSTESINLYDGSDWSDFGVEFYTIQRKDDATWISLQSIAAYGSELYTTEVRTLSDSTSIDSALTEFRVIAAMIEGNFLSIETVTGYSVDNIAPATLTSLSGVFDENKVVLSWDPSEDEDLSHYNIYRNTEMHSTTTETSFIDEITEETEYTVSAVDIHENESDMSESILVSMPLKIIDNLIPTKYELMTAYPNPFNPITNITYGLPEYVNVQIMIFDVSGKQVASLINELQSPGYHNINWNADSHSSGVYFMKMIADEHISTQKLMLVK